jgi:hypothetical protein
MSLRAKRSNLEHLGISMRLLRRYPPRNDVQFVMLLWNHATSWFETTMTSNSKFLAITTLTTLAQNFRIISCLPVKRAWLIWLKTKW